MAKRDVFYQCYVDKFPTAFTFWSQDQFFKATLNLRLFKEREHWIFKIAENLIEIFNTLVKQKKKYQHACI